MSPRPEIVPPVDSTHTRGFADGGWACRATAQERTAASDSFFIVLPARLITKPRSRTKNTKDSLEKIDFVIFVFLRVFVMNRCTYCFGFADGFRAGAASIALTGCGTVSVRLYFASVALNVVALAIAPFKSAIALGVCDFTSM